MPNDAYLPKILMQPDFMLGARAEHQWPEDVGYEVGFAGRSNVGKSSALNRILQRKKIARTSKTPGRTQEINFFSLDDSRRLVDLPGYGFAKVPLAMRKEWEDHISSYLEKRQSLKGIVLLMDIRHPLTALDQDILNWIRNAQLPAHILLTKSDKLKPGAAKSTLLHVARKLEEIGIEGSIQTFSAENGDGLADARSVITEWLDAS